MIQKIKHLLYEDHDLFWKSLSEIAEGEINREVISSRLKAWYKDLKEVVDKLPYDAMPVDDE